MESTYNKDLEIPSANKPADLQTAKFRQIGVELQYIILQVRFLNYFKRLLLPPSSPSLISEYFQPVVHSFCSHFGDANCDFFGSQKTTSTEAEQN